MSVRIHSSRFIRRAIAASLGLAIAIATQFAATPASAQSSGAAERSALRAWIDDGLTKAEAWQKHADAPTLVTLTPRDTLYLYDMVHGNVKMIATSPNGGLIRRIVALRLLAGPWRFGGTSDVATPPRSRHGIRARG